MTPLETCLPPKFRGPGTTIARVGAGLSSAGVYRVEAGGKVYVLKIKDAAEPLAEWRGRLYFHRLAAEAGLAPGIVHVDEVRRAVVSEFVVDRSFPGFYHNPATRGAALTLLGRTLRGVHALPLPADVVAGDPRKDLALVWADLAGDSVPAFVADAVRRVLDAAAPASGRAPVASHNDVNPSNLLFDGERLLLADWEAAGVNDPFYDLAAIAVFLRMDEATCAQLLAAHDDAPVTALPASFIDQQRLVAILCGATLLRLARRRGHPGASSSETLDSTPALGDFYQRLRSGAINLATPEGQCAFGLTLAKTSAGY